MGDLLNFQNEKGQNLSEDQISDNIIGVLFAAQDTTASVLTWILKYLHDNQNILEAVKVRIPQKLKLSCKLCMRQIGIDILYTKLFYFAG